MQALAAAAIANMPHPNREIWCKDVRNISEYFGLVLCIYDGSNRSCHELICISLSHVMSHVLSHVMSQSKSHVKSHSCKSHS